MVVPRPVSLLLLLLPLAVARPGAAQDSVARASAMIEAAIAQAGRPATGTGDAERDRAWLRRLYTEAGMRPVWTSGARPTAPAYAAMAALATVETRGLRPDDYDAEPLRRAAVELGRREATTLDERVRFDVRLSASLVRLLAHLHDGRADPRALGFALPSKRTRLDLAATALAIARGADLDSVLRAVEPRFERFAALETVLARYRTLAADTALRPPPASTRSIRVGERWPGVVPLAHLLVALGDMPPADAIDRSDIYSPAMAEGVRSFQRRHGLEADGVLGRSTLAQLRMPLARRAAQMELTLERWRWLPDDSATRVAVVNIPGFRLYLVDRAAGAERPMQRLDVIVGRAYGGRRTPVFAGTMRTVIFHPYWDVPNSIARREEVPRFRRDPAAARREGFEIVAGDDATGVPLTDANLARVAAGRLRLRQRPGPGNALGPVKFVFPNEYNVYLHGTPTASLFERARRDFSHGCIRVSDPAALAGFVLQGQEGWDRSSIASAMREGAATLAVPLARPLPVYILYATVVVDDEGRPRFYPDIYGHDTALARVLRLPYATEDRRTVASDGDERRCRLGLRETRRERPGEPLRLRPVRHEVVARGVGRVAGVRRDPSDHPAQDRIIPPVRHRGIAARPRGDCRRSRARFADTAAPPFDRSCTRDDASIAGVPWFGARQPDADRSA